MTRIIQINDKGQNAEALLNYLKTLDFVTFIDSEKISEDIIEETRKRSLSTKKEYFTEKEFESKLEKM